MIKESIKQAIISQLRIHMLTEHYKYIDEMFTEIYQTNYEGLTLYTLKPHPEAGDIAMQFNAINGSFFEITSWSYIKTIGEKL